MDAQRIHNSQDEPEATWGGLLRGLSNCGRLAQRALAAELDSELSPSQAALLWTCREMELQDANQLELARRIGMSPAQVSGLVEELRRRELITSERSPRDRRRQTWKLTDAGQQKVRSLDEQLEAWSVACRHNFGSAKLAEMFRNVQTFATFLDQLSSAGSVVPIQADTLRRGAAA